jgi:DNA repair exonuclease SbcCD nuclease subunit
MATTDPVRVMFIGDPHFRQQYIKVVDEFVRQTIEMVETQKPDVVVVGGDTLHDHEQARESCQSRAIAWFKELALRAYTIVLIGNHDRPNNQHFLTKSHFFTGLEGTKNLKVVDNAAFSVELKKSDITYRFIAVPYVPNGRFAEALKTLKTSIESHPPAAIFAHQEFKGVKMGAMISEEGDVWPAEGPLVISGHIHEQQIIGGNIFYVGTPYQTSFAEEPNKGIWFFDFKGNGAPAARLVKLKLRVKQSVTIAPKDLPTFKAPDATFDFRLIITGPQEEVEACKQTRAYKDLHALPHVKIVCRPILDIKSIVGQEEKPLSYLQRLYDAVKEKPAHLNAYQRVLGGTQ